MQTTSLPMTWTAPVQSQESENHPPTVHVERIDPALLHLVSVLFPAQFEGLKFLALLCRRAREKQLALFKEPVAVVTFHGLAALCASPDWPWGYHATLRYFVVFEALGILIRLRTNRLTEVRIPLGMREEPLNRERLLQSLEALQKKTPNKRAYKDKKLVQLIERVKKHIFLYRLGASGDSLEERGEALGNFDLASLPIVEERLVSVMSSEHIPLAKCRRIAQWICTNQIPQLFREYAERSLLQKGDSQIGTRGLVGRYQCTQGDSQLLTDQKEREQGGDSRSDLGDSQTPQTTDSIQLQQDVCQKNRPGEQLHVLDAGEMTLKEASKPAISDPGGLHLEEKGDSLGRLSSNTSLSSKILREEKIDIDVSPASTSHGKSPCSEQSILAEATWIAIRLDGKESLKQNRGRGWIGAYKTKLEEHPFLVRCAMIDMFMQKAFPDWQGPPQKRGGLWFNRAYKEYALEQKPVPSLIESWARSPYHYKQIEKVLVRERKRQEGEIEELRRGNPFYAEGFVRPTADCVETYRLLCDEKISLPHMLFEEDDPATLAPNAKAGPFDGSTADAEQESVVEMEDGTCLSREEYEHLEKRAILEETSRLVALLSDPSQQAKDMLAASLECWVAKQLSSPPRTVSDQLQQFRAILSPDLYEAEVRIVSPGTYGIVVAARGNKLNQCLLSAEEGETFLDSMTHIPNGVMDDALQLQAVLEGKYTVELWLPTIAAGGYELNVRQPENPANACQLRGPLQTKKFLRRMSNLPPRLSNDMEKIQGILDPASWVAELFLPSVLDRCPALNIRARYNPENAYILRGSDEVEAFGEWWQTGDMEGKWHREDGEGNLLTPLHSSEENQVESS